PPLSSRTSTARAGTHLSLPSSGEMGPGSRALRSAGMTVVIVQKAAVEPTRWGKDTPAEIIRGGCHEFLTSPETGCQIAGGGFRKESKWECGACAPAHNSAAAPATVGGESPAIGATGKCSVSWEGGRKRRPASQETCHRVMSHARLRRTGCADVKRTAVVHSLPRAKAGCGTAKKSR